MESTPENSSYYSTLLFNARNVYTPERLKARNLNVGNAENRKKHAGNIKLKEKK